MKRASGAWRPPSGRWTASDGAAVVAAFEASGQSISEFARSHGLRPNRVWSWVNKQQKKATKSKPSGFMAAALVDAQRPSESSGRDQASDDDPASTLELEVRLGCGRCLVFRGAWPSQQLVAWVNALESRS